MPLHPVRNFQPPTGSKQLWVMTNSCLWHQTVICEYLLVLLCSCISFVHPSCKEYIRIFILGAKSQEVVRITELLQWGGISCGLFSSLGLRGGSTLRYLPWSFPFCRLKKPHSFRFPSPSLLNPVISLVTSTGLQFTIAFPVRQLPTWLHYSRHGLMSV